MAINYGTQSTLEPLNPEKIGVVGAREEEKKDTSWTDFLFSSTFLKGMIIVLELGLSFFPPKKLVTESAKMIFQIGLGLLSATGTTAIDIANKNVSAATIAIDFGTAFIPYGTYKLVQAKNFRKLQKGIRALASKQDEFVENVKVGKEAVEAKFKQQVKVLTDKVSVLSDKAKVIQSGEPFAKKNKLFIKFFKKPKDIRLHVQSLATKDIKKFLATADKNLWNLTKIKHDAALLNLIAPNGDIAKATKEFPQLFETLLHKSVRDARWNPALNMWQNFRMTAPQKYIENANLLQQGLLSGKYYRAMERVRKVCNKIDDILKAKNVTLKQLTQRADDYIQMINDLQKIGKNAVSTKKALTKVVSNISTNKKLNKLAVQHILYSKKQLRLSAEIAKSNAVVQEVLSELKDKPQQLENFEALISLVKNVKANPQAGLKSGAEQIQTFLKPLLQTFDNDTLVFIHKLNNAKSVWKGSPTQLQEVVDFLASNVEVAYRGLDKTSKIKNFIRYLGSQKFDDKVVQRVQNIFDPRDAGRYGVERVYRKINQIVQKQINKFTENKVVNDAIKKATKNLNKINVSENVADAVVQFERVKQRATKVVKTTTTKGYKFQHKYSTVQQRVMHKVKGGTSRYLSHYYIYGKKGIYFVVAMHFKRRFYKTGNNKHGKKPVWITATRDELYNIKTIGGTYWKEKALMRGWEQSRGGRRHSNRSFGQSRDLSLFLMLVPINPLRRVLSLVSNIVEGGYSMATGNFFTRRWVEKFTESFANTLKNRIGRLITRTGTKYIGNRVQSQALKKISASMKEYRLALRKTQSKINFLARNVQKTGSLLLNNLRFDFTKGTFQVNTKNYGRKTSQQFFRQYGPTSIRSALIHKTASKRRNYVFKRKLQGASSKQIAWELEKIKNPSRQLISGRRKFGQVLRIKSAVTPNPVFSKSFRGLTKFKF